MPLCGRGSFALKFAQRLPSLCYFLPVTEEEFQAFFSQFGKLMDCIVMVDRETNRSRGFGFVSFEDPDVAKKLLAMGREGTHTPSEPVVGRLEMRGKTIEVKAAQPRDSAPNRRHFYRNDRRGNQPTDPALLAKTELSAAAFAPAYDYAASYYPYYPLPMASEYSPHGYYTMMPTAASGNMNYFQYAPYAYGPGVPAYEPNWPVAATSHRPPSIHPVTPGVKTDDRPANTTATVA